MNVVFGMFFMVVVVMFVIWCSCKIDPGVPKTVEQLSSREDLTYKKLKTILPNLNKDIFQRTLHKRGNDCACFILSDLKLFYLNQRFYKSIFNVFDQNYYFYDDNEIHLDLICDFNSMCELDDRVGELREIDSLSYRNFLINSFLEKYGQKLVRSGNESYYVSNYTLKQKYCLNIEDKKKYINEKYSLSNE